MYGELPVKIAEVYVNVEEMMFYQYLPIKLPNQTAIYSHHMERRLEPFAPLVAASSCDYIANYGLDRFVDSYVYLTVKNLFVSPEYNMNREGWHSDGFMTDDINYIWSNKIPTVFNCSPFRLTQDDKVSIKEMEQQARPENDFVAADNTLLRLNQYVVHKCGPITQGTVRAFFKLSVSLEAYDLVGNSINYGLDYGWKYKLRQRGLDRNIPQNVVK